MFTGIIESTGRITKITRNNSNLEFHIESDISNELKVDQSVAHDGCCLTVEEVSKNSHVVTAIQETLDKTNLESWKEGDKVNLERAMKMGDRLDGHMVQGHVDATAKCISIENKDGSWRFNFSFPESFSKLIVPKGSICINGISLTANEPSRSDFSVDIIPYTYENTNIHQIEAGDTVNLEFDILGKYVERMMNER